MEKITAVATKTRTARAAPPQDTAGSLLSFVAMAVKDPTIDVHKLDALLRMQREIIADDARTQFAHALHAAQKEMPRVKKNGTVELEKGGVSRGSFRFATWEDVDAIVRPIAERHGFSVTFSSVDREAGGGPVMSATFTHLAGHEKTISMPLPLDAGAGRNSIQAAGSTNSYGKRYLTENFYNVVREGADDDAQRAGKTYIRADQVAALVAALKRRNFAVRDFCKLLGVGSIEAIEAGALGRAKDLLARYKTTRGAAPAQVGDGFERAADGRPPASTPAAAPPAGRRRAVNTGTAQAA